MIYNVMYNIGKVKFLVNFYDGIKKHSDGSNFYDVKCFKSKKKMENFINQIKKDNYVKNRF